jgi:hypothetical protein
METYRDTPWIKQAVGRQLAGRWATNSRTYAGFSDSGYFLPSLQELSEFLSANQVQWPARFTEGFDCDDFTFVLKGRVSLYCRDQLGESRSLCIGIAWGKFDWRPGLHACNWSLVDTGEFRWIEPQDPPNGALRTVGHCSGDLRWIVV